MEFETVTDATLNEEFVNTALPEIVTTEAAAQAEEFVTEMLIETTMATVENESVPCIAQIPCVCNCNNEQQPEQATTISNAAETETNNAEQTTLTSIVADSTAGPEATTTTAAAASSSSTAAISTEAPTTAAPAPITCSIMGKTAHEQNCHQYYACSPNAEGILVQTLQTCPERMAFSTELLTCTRDLIACNNDGIVCSATALSNTFPDPLSNTAYYWCVPSLLGGYHKYHVQCRKGDIFNTLLQKCFMDMDNMQNLPLDYGLGPDDEDYIKMELKTFKMHEKQILKEQKLKAKMEQKLQKELAKKAEKEAKEKAKLLDATFVCPSAGNFASPLSENQYYACVLKKGIVRPMRMICPMGYTFDAAQSVCVFNANAAMKSAEEDEDDEEIDD